MCTRLLDVFERLIMIRVYAVTWLHILQIFFPLAPGIESIWEPLQEEVQQRYEEMQTQIDDMVDGMQLGSSSAWQTETCNHAVAMTSKLYCLQHVWHAPTMV